MTLEDARKHLNRVREGYAMSLAITTQALQRTGDIPDFPDKPLRSNGDEPKTIEQARHRTAELKKDFPTLGISIANRIKELKNDAHN
mgnify:CR=1 FL=1